MKQFTIALLLTGLLSFPLLAEQQTLFGDNLEIGGFGGPTIKLTTLSGSSGILVGGRGGAIINSKFTIGGGGYGLTNKINLGHFSDYRDELSLQMGYGGAEIGYIHKSDDLIHFTAYCLIAGGGISIGEDNGENTYNNQSDWYNVENDGFFVLEPTASVELNVTKAFRIEVGAGYRYVNGLDNIFISNEDISGLSGVITFKFGRYSKLFGISD